MSKATEKIQKIYYTYKSISNVNISANSTNQELVPPYRYFIISYLLLAFAEAIGIFFYGQINTLSSRSNVDITSYASIEAEIGDTASQITYGLIHFTISGSIFVIATSTIFCCILALTSIFILRKLPKYSVSNSSFEIDNSIYRISNINIDYALAWLLLSTVAFAIGEEIPSIARSFHSPRVGSIVFVVAYVIILLAMKYRANRLQKKFNATNDRFQADTWIALTVAGALPFLLLMLSLISIEHFQPGLSFRVNGPCQKEGCFVYLQSNNYSKNVYVDGTIFIPISPFPINTTSSSPKPIGRLEIRVIDKQGDGPVLLKPNTEQVAKISHIILVCYSPMVIDKQKIQFTGNSDTVVYVPDQKWGYAHQFFKVTPNGFLPFLFRENSPPLQKEHCLS